VGYTSAPKTVLLAEDNVDRFVALKSLPEEVSKGEQALERLVCETTGSPAIEPDDLHSFPALGKQVKVLMVWPRFVSFGASGNDE
jgi:hypothetical protein